LEAALKQHLMDDATDDVVLKANVCISEDQHMHVEWKPARGEMSVKAVAFAYQRIPWQ